MSLECLNDIILDDLVVHIDLNDTQSWNLNSGLTSVSLTKWNQATSSDLNLPDFGLTGYDNGFIDNMLSGYTLIATDNNLKLYRVGYNTTGGTNYSGYTITTVTGSSVGTYFNLDGGYLQGFSKLEDYDFEVLPPRYNNGITIETIVEILPTSQGIFFLMGTRAEDKYNPFYSGETFYSGGTVPSGHTGKVAVRNSTGGTDYIYDFSGITTSEDNYLNAYLDTEIVQDSAILPTDLRVTVQKESPQINNLKDNLIVFELTSDKKLKYKYIDGDGNLQFNSSSQAITRTGWTQIDIVFRPDSEIEDYDSSNYQCPAQRNGKLLCYINGRLFWSVNNFTEWFSRPINNDREKQLGVPFNIGWGGGSFGLKHSWHFTSGTTPSTLIQDTRKNDLFIEQYFNSSFIGNIQKLRIYDNALNSQEVLHNAKIESANTSGYSITVNLGGRIITRNTYE